MTDDPTPPDAGVQTADEKAHTESLTAGRSAAIHRELGTVGGKVNEAHAHLSALRSAEHRTDEAAPEIARAEVEAMVQTLADAQEHLEAAIDLSVQAAQEIEPPDPTASDDGEAADATDVESEREDDNGGKDDDEDDDAPPELLWNMAGHRYAVPFDETR